MTCSVEGCDEPQKARTWCNTHYARWHRLGTVHLPQREPKFCHVGGCTSPLYSNGVCVRHYYYLRRYGTPVIKRPTLRERIEAGFDLDDHGCWIWRNKPGANGYGRISVKNKENYAHRVSYELYVGPIPPGLCIDHLCRVRRCINPEHLEAVTLAENTRREFEAKRAAA